MITKETEKLLQQYFTALSNFYNIISLDEAYRIIYLQNPQLRLSPADFIAFAKAHQEKQGDYYLDQVEPYFADAPNGSPTFLLDDSVSVGNTFYNLYSLQEGAAYYLPTKHELLKYVDEDYYLQATSGKVLQKFLSEELGLSGERLAEVYDEILLFLFTVDEDNNEVNFAEILADLQRIQVAMDDFQKDQLVIILNELEPTMRIPRRRGFTEVEWAHQAQIMDPFEMADKHNFAKPFRKLVKQGAVDLNEFKKVIQYNYEFDTDPIVDNSHRQALLKRLAALKVPHLESPTLD